MGEERNISGRLNGSAALAIGDAELLEAMVEGASEGLGLALGDSVILQANRAAVGMMGDDHPGSSAGASMTCSSRLPSSVVYQ